MAVTRTIFEYCKYCGALDVEIRGDEVIWPLHHNCPSAPPGPPSYPRRLKLSQVQFVRNGKKGDIILDVKPVLVTVTHIGREQTIKVFAPLRPGISAVAMKIEADLNAFPEMELTPGEYRPSALVLTLKEGL